MIMSQIPETSSVIGEERVYLRNIHTPYAVRRFTHAILAEWDLMPMVEDVELVATELATNAIRNALGDTIAVRIERAEGSAGSVCVKVWDDNPEPPVPQAPPPTTPISGTTTTGASSIPASTTLQTTRPTTTSTPSPAT